MFSTNSSNLGIAALAAFGLAACGGAAEITGMAGSHNIGAMPGDIGAIYAAGPDQLIVFVADGVSQMTLEGTGEFNGVQTFAGGVGTSALIDISLSEDGYVLVVASPAGDLTAAPIAGVQIGRSGETTLPQSGGATYAGQYSGILVRETTGISLGFLGGDAELTVDFAAQTISGEITNRFQEVDPLANITLGAAAINSNAGFTGVAAGGEYFASGGTTSNGSYSGLLVGSSGVNIVGGIVLNHFVAGTDLIEIGGFSGTQ